jgi:hypothetical protein
MAGLIQDDNKVGGVPQSASKYVAMSTCFDIFFNGDTHIGFINSLTINHTRTVTQIRHLNSVDAGIAVDTVVTPDAPTLSFNGFYVYANIANEEDLLESRIGSELTDGETGVGSSAGRIAGIQLLMSLDQQNIPFDIVVRHAYPSTIGSAPGPKVSNSDSASGNIVGAYKNCTISGMTVPINIGTAAISDSGNISVGYVSSKA